MKSSPEVLIYLQSVKNYLNTNKEAYDYFLKDINEDFFYKHLQEISQKNYEKNGEAMLSMEQFELLRKTSISIAISESGTTIEDKLFFEVKNFGKVCLN